MNGHVRRKDGGWAICLDTGKEPAQRCDGACAKTFTRRGRQVVVGKVYWVGPKGPLAACPSCGGPLQTTEQRRQRWVGGFERKQDAQAELRRRLTAKDEQEDPFPANITLRQYAERWLAAKVPGRRTASGNPPGTDTTSACGSTCFRPSVRFGWRT